MVRGIACAANLAEQLRDIPGKDALVLELSEKVVLTFLARRIEADLGRHDLRLQLGELAQLEEARCSDRPRNSARQEHPEPHELLGRVRLEVNAKLVRSGDTR